MLSCHDRKANRQYTNVYYGFYACSSTGWSPGRALHCRRRRGEGLLQKQELTNSKFIDSPFEPGSKLYRTGDMARWLPGGRIEYIGRIDNQVKIRGFRIELGDIESRLSEHPGIQECVVVAAKENGMDKLAAYYTAKHANASLAARELRHYVKDVLPAYMVPSYFIQLDHMPLTPNGKIDRNSLKNNELTAKQPKQREISPKNIQDAVFTIWQDVLKMTDIEWEDGFFDVGGDSLLAVTVADRIKHELTCEFSVTDLFEYSTIKNISQYITEQRKADTSGPMPTEPAAHIDQSTQMNDLPDYYEDSVAIIGISCEFPGRKTMMSFGRTSETARKALRFIVKKSFSVLAFQRRWRRMPAMSRLNLQLMGKTNLTQASFKSLLKTLNLWTRSFGCC